ncbi:MAG TPA: gamma-glutamyl-gamma-aminobutyrate hydrolase family protein [Planctomycetota bacterium]|jgi:putative glutamine amidotransferase|nr:gamma-glutamyl-gamma-aminobutyrate hydrolase family protein [Planctomycetota bacterium]
MASRPLIGINCEFDPGPDGGRPRLNEKHAAYVEAILRAGGVPVLLAPFGGPEAAAEAVSRCDGVLFTGGRDIHPSRYGETVLHPKTEVLPREKEDYDFALARAARERGLPVLGICGGMQLLNVAFGGALHQHLPDAFPSSEVEHGKGTHAVRVDADSRLVDLVGPGPIQVMTSHHQAVRRCGEGLRPVARTADDVIEAVEGTGRSFVIGVLWHPERTPDAAASRALFAALVAGARPRG